MKTAAAHRRRTLATLPASIAALSLPLLAAAGCIAPPDEDAPVASREHLAAASQPLAEPPQLDLDDADTTCHDGAQNGGETGVDCGGPCRMQCADGGGCVVAGDCQSGVCTGGVCQAPACGDGVPNGSETCDDGGTSDGDRCSPACALQEVVELAAGASHTCALLMGGSVKCWGDNAFGQLGLGDVSDRGDGFGEMGSSLPPVNLGAGRKALHIAAGAHHNCAMLDNGTVKCWGSGYGGKLGIGTTQNRGDGPNEMGNSLPAVNLGTFNRAVQLDLGWNHSCAVLGDGAVACWGRNDQGQLGLGDTVDRSTPEIVDLGAGKVAIAVSAGDSHTCAALSDGSVKCWGSAAFGLLGLGNTQSRGDGPGEMGDSLPAVDLGPGAVAAGIAAGSIHSCALLAGGSLKCWGFNGYGQLGLGDTQNRGDGPGEMGGSLPALDLGAGAIAVEVSAGAYHTCARLDGGSLKCWGRNVDGQLGLGDTVTRGDGPGEMGGSLAALNLGTGRTVAWITAGATHGCALLDNGATRCWGYNLEGQLGHGDTSTWGDWWSEVGYTPITKLFSSAW